MITPACFAVRCHRLRFTSLSEAGCIRHGMGDFISSARTLPRPFACVKPFSRAWRHQHRPGPP